MISNVHLWSEPLLSTNWGDLTFTLAKSACVGVREGVRVKVGVRVGVDVREGVKVIVGVRVIVGDGVSVGVLAGVNVAVGAGVAVDVGVSEVVAVGVGVDTRVGILVGVRAGPTVWLDPQLDMAIPAIRKIANRKQVEMIFAFAMVLISLLGLSRASPATTEASAGFFVMHICRLIHPADCDGA